MISVSQGVEYFPKRDTELTAYNFLWTCANPNNLPEIGGLQAVEFFKKSDLDMILLKKIWSLCTPTSVMNIVQFYSALRYIAMAQNGIRNLTPETLHSCSDWSLKEPKFLGIDISAGTITEVSEGFSATKTTTTTGSFSANVPSGDVEVKRIIWVELDGQPDESSYDSSLRKRLLDERAALAQALRDEEYKTLSELSNVEVITKEVQLLETTLLKLRHQGSFTVNGKQAEAQKKKLLAQISDTNYQLDELAVMKAAAERRALEDNTFLDQQNLEQHALEERLRYMRQCLEESTLQQMETHEMLSRRIEERNLLRKQVEEAQRSMLTVESEAPKSARTLEAEELERRRLMEQIAEMRRQLLRNESISTDHRQELSTLREILAGLQADVREKQAKSQLVVQEVSDDQAASEKAMLLRRINEARAQLALDTQAVDIRVRNLEDIADLRRREFNYANPATNAELETLRNVVLGLEGERNSISAELTRLTKEYEDAKAALEAERAAMLNSSNSGGERNPAIEEERNRLVLLIAQISQQMNEDSRLIREIADKFSSIEMERVQIAGMLSNIDESTSTVTSETIQLLEEVESLKRSVARLEEEESAMYSEKMRFEEQASNGLQDLNSSIDTYKQRESELREKQQTLEKLRRDREILIEHIRFTEETIKRIADEINSAAIQATEIDSQIVGLKKQHVSLETSARSTSDTTETDLTIEIKLLQEELNRLEQEKAAMNSELKLLTDTLNSSTIALEQNKTSLTELQAVVDVKDKRLSQLIHDRDVYASLKKASSKELDDLKMSVAAARNKVASLKAAIAEATQSQAALEAKHKTILIQIEGLDGESVAMDSENSNVYDELKALQAILDGLLDEIDALTTSLEAQSSRRQVVEEELASANLILSDKEQEIIRLREESKALNDARNLISSEINDNRATVTRIEQEIHKTAADVEGLADSVSNVNHDIRKANETVFVLSSNNKECKTEIESLREVADALRLEAGAFTAELNSVLDQESKAKAQLEVDRLRLKNLEADLQKQRDQETALLGEKSLLIEQIAQAREKVKEASHLTSHHSEQLMGTEDERAKLEHALNSADASIFIIQSANKETLSEVEHMKSILASLEEEKKSIEEEMGRLANRHSDSHSTVAELRAQLKSKESELIAVEERGKSIEQDKDDVAAKIADARAAVASITAEAMQASNELNSVEDIKASYEHKLHALHETKFEKERENIEMSSEVESMRHILAALEKELKEIQGELGRIARERSGADSALSDEQARIRALEAEIAKLAAESSSLGVEKSDVLQKISSLRQQVAELDEETIRQNNVFADLKALTEAMSNKSAAIDADVEAARLDAERQRLELENLRKVLATVQKEHDDAVEALDNAKLAATLHRDLHATKSQEYQEAKENLLKEYQDTAGALVSEKEDAVSKHGQLTNAIEEFSALIDEHNDEADQLKSAIDNLANQRSELDGAIGAAQAEIDDHNEALRELRDRLKDAEGKHTELAGTYDSAKLLSEQRRLEEQLERDRIAAKEKELSDKKSLASALDQERRAVEAQIRHAQQKAREIAEAQRIADAKRLADELERMRQLEAVAQQAKEDFERLEQDRKKVVDQQARLESKSKVVRQPQPITISQPIESQSASIHSPLNSTESAIPSVPVSGTALASPEAVLGEPVRVDNDQGDREKLAQVQAAAKLHKAHIEAQKNARRAADEQAIRAATARMLAIQEAEDRARKEAAARLDAKRLAEKQAAQSPVKVRPDLDTDLPAEESRLVYGAVTPSSNQPISPKTVYISQGLRESTAPSQAVDLYPVVAPSVIVSTSAANTPEKSGIGNGTSPAYGGSQVGGYDASKRSRKSDVMPGFDLIAELLVDGPDSLSQ